MSVDSADVVLAIVEAVADRERVPPAELPPFQGVIDCDALHSLYDTADGRTRTVPSRLEITYCDRRVAVNGDGDATVPPRTAPER